jgi:16S rRNA (uracil1498-N3)-methyltransferase
VVERADRAAIATFYAPGEWRRLVDLGGAAAHHAGVKRLATGGLVQLTSGDGRRATGAIAELGRTRLVVDVDAGSIEMVPAPAHVELWAPVADRERMLLLGEKAVELGASAWRPIVYQRSRSVSPRGEGDTFREKLRLRMISALEQSGSAWLPTLHLESSLDEALSGVDAAALSGVLLDAGGVPLASIGEGIGAPVALALGPEGGLDADERAAFVAADWRTASLGVNVLRFETAGIAALAVIRSLIR